MIFKTIYTEFHFIFASNFFFYLCNADLDCDLLKISKRFFAVDGIYSLPWNAYIMDVNSDMKRKKLGFFYMLQRVVWKRPINFDNSKIVAIFFNQVIPLHIHTQNLANKSDLRHHFFTTRVAT